MGDTKKDRPIEEAKDTRGEFQPQPDLVKEAQDMLKFLEQVENVSDSLHQDHVIHNAVRRYETIWLPLLEKHSDILLQPPLDVHWVWHVHMLCPRKYASDCVKIISLLPQHRYDADGELARVLWEKYTDEPFDVDYQDIPNETYFESCLRYDIVAASQRQKGFYYHVSLPHFTYDSFLNKALRRYQMFVNLKRYRPTAFLVPVYDIDLLWHAHQCCPQEYQQDMGEFLSYVLNHDDTATERGPGSKLGDATSNTRDLWNQAYSFVHDPYFSNGAMYRGPNPRGQLALMAKKEQDNVFHLSYSVTVTSVTVTGNLKAKYKISGTVEYSMTNSSKLSLKKGIPFEWRGSLLSFDVEYCDPAILTLDLQRRDGFWGTIQAKQFQQIEFPILAEDLAAEFREHQGEGECSYQVTSEGTDGVKATIELQVLAGRASDETLVLHQGTFRTTTTPTYPDFMLNSVPMKTPGKGPGNDCVVALHTIKDYKDNIRFTVQVTHSTKLRLSVVQVYHWGTLVALAHTIGNEQLPSSGDGITLDSGKGERAMIIKNGSGDWAIVKGRWMDFRKGNPEALSTKMRRGHPGHLKVTYHDLLSGTETVRNMMEEGWTLFELTHIGVRLQQETIVLKAETEYVAENVALALCSCILYVLCEPRFDPPGIPNKTSKVKPMGRDIPLFRAAGYSEKTPSNSYLFWHYYQHRGRRHSGSSASDLQNHAESDEGQDHCDGVWENHRDDCLSFCPWEPEKSVDDVITSLESDSCRGTWSTSATSGCGGCASSCGSSGDGGGGGNNSGGGAGSSCASSCYSSGGGGGGSSSGGGGGSGGGGSSCGSSCGSDCGSDCGGGGSSCGGD